MCKRIVIADIDANIIWEAVTKFLEAILEFFFTTTKDDDIRALRNKVGNVCKN